MSSIRAARVVCPQARLVRAYHQKRSIHPSVKKSNAAARETSSFSDLYRQPEHLFNPRPATATPTQVQSSVLQQIRQSKEDLHYTPFENRAFYNGPLTEDKEHFLAWNGVDLNVTKITSTAPPVKVSHWWLRDHCPCFMCTHPVTKQRQVNNLVGQTFAPKIRNCHISHEAKVVEVEWSDGHHSIYPTDFIVRKQAGQIDGVRRGNTELKFWGSEIQSDVPSVPYEEVKAGNLSELMRKLRVYGICAVPGTPVTADDCESIMKQIGPIRDTHFGAFHTITCDLTSKDTAYTSESLEPHTDTTYFQDGVGLQMLALLDHQHGTGGESIFLDGFNLARQMYEEAPELYQSLAKYGVYGQATGNEGVNMQPTDALPVLRHDSQNTELLQVRWNNADRAGVAAPMHAMDSWYAAASKWQELMDRKSNRWEFKLQPGTPLLFDNWRLLHGRTAFTGRRAVCGGYINRDDFISKYKCTNYSEADLNASTVTG